MAPFDQTLSKMEYITQLTQSIKYQKLEEYLNPTSALVVVGLVAATYWTRWLIRYIGVRWQVRGLPQVHSLIEVFESGVRGQIPHVPFLIPIKKFTLEDPWKKYADAGSDLIAATQATTPYAVYITSNPAVAQQISAKASLFDKPLDMFRYQAINIFGKQIVSTHSGPEHRRHKTVVRGCFGEEVMANAWEKIAVALQVMLKEEKLTEGGVLRDIRAVLVKTTLIVIGEAGFGLEVPWHIAHTDGPILPFSEALSIVDETLPVQLLIPMWLMTYFPSRYLRRCAKAQRSLLKHMKDLIATRRAKLAAEHATLNKDEKVRPPTDLLGALVASQLDVQRGNGEDSKGLTEEEIIGNVFIFIIAGHETTAHTLTFVLAYLALYPETQDRLYDEITAACGDELPTYRDMNALPLCLGAVYEALRLRDLVMTLAKVATHDTVLSYTTWDPSAPAPSSVTHHTFPIKAGSHIIIDSPASQRNPFFWADPTKYDPTRHLPASQAQNPQGPFVGFSLGSRQCIGKRFAEVEQVSLLSHLIKTYKFYPVTKDGESWEQTRDRILKTTEELTLTPAQFDLRFERRA